MWGDIGLGALDAAGVTWEYLPRTVATFEPTDLAP